MELRVKQEAAVDKVKEMTSAQGTITDSLLEATSALAENLAQSKPFLQFQEAERRLHEDIEAMQLLTKFSELQQKIFVQQNAGAIAEGDISWLRELQRAIGADETIQERNQAQEKAVEFLREVNQEISDLLGIDFASLTRHSSGCC